MGTLELQNLTYSYDKKKKVLRGIDARMEAGKMYAILGPSGCGKTTLLSLLGGLDSPTSGANSVPCVIADELTEEQIKAFRLVDNKVGELAEWDVDLLPLELADIAQDLSPFGFETISEDAFGEEFTLDSGEKKPYQQISLTLHDKQAELILACIDYVHTHGEVKETFGNENHKGNGVYEVVRQWAEQKKLV